MIHINSNKREFLLKIDSDLIFLEGFDEAIIGTGERCGLNVVAYNKDKLIDMIMEEDDYTYDEAMECYEYNILGSHIGEKSPIFIKNINYN